MSDQENVSLERLREQVIERLSLGYSHDFLSEQEFEERLETATSAQSHSELRGVILDLPVAGSPNAPAVAGEQVPAERESPFPINRGNVSDESSVIAIFSGSDRKGVWDPPKTLNAMAMFGGIDIDLRDANFPPDGMTIHAVAMLGGIDVIVPHGINVEIGGIGIFGSFEGSKRKGAPIPGAPTVKIDGAAIFGGVDVKFKERK